MFHRASSIGGESHNISTRPRASMLQTRNKNENINIGIKNSKNSSSANTTTPMKNSVHQQRSSRRAFGDISNKKASNGAQNTGNGKCLEPSKNRQTLKPRSNYPDNSFSKQSFPSKIPKSGSSTKLKNPRQPLSTKRSHPWSTTIQSQRSSSASSKPSASPAPSRRQVDFVLPISSREAQSQNNVQATTQLPLSIRSESKLPVDDVELPAGRLWKEQIADEQSDLASTQSIDDLLEDRTMWDDWSQSMNQKWQEEERRMNLRDENFVQAQIDQVLKEDGRGIEKLFDLAELEANHTQDDLDLHLDLLLEDDEWSAPASSIEGTLALDDF